MLGLISLPYEVLSNIVGNIDFDDVFNLGLTCKSFTFLITEESLCKAIVQSKIPYSIEATKATSGHGGFAAALRGTAKRRSALATVSPFTAAIVGLCDAYLYCKGVLCYTLDDKVRILNLHDSAEQEIVFTIPGLLNRALPGARDHTTGNFQIMYYSDRIISCLYKSSGSNSTPWLIAFSFKNRAVLVVRELDSTEKLFVRHSDEFLYYGTHSEIDFDGHKKWTIYGYDFRKRHWFDEKIYLSGMAGSDIGSSVCFEFYGKYFYALSNQTSFEVEEIDWTSFYHCIRFPLDSPCKALIEKTQDKDMWRRQHQEGPIDERWMSLQLHVDETSGELKIVESRKEWYLGSSRSQRNYYTTEIKFPEPNQDEEDEISRFGDMSTNPKYDFSDSFSSNVSSTSSRASSRPQATPSSSSTAASSEPHELFDNTGLPNSQLLRLRKKDDNPHYLEAPPRIPHYTHPGDDGSAQLTYTLAKTRLRMYHASCSTFMDLVDDPLPIDYTGTQRLRLRGGSRRLGPPLRDDDGLLCQYSTDLHTAIDKLYVAEEVKFWPPAQDPSPGNENLELDDIYMLLNPPSHLGGVEGTVDDRSLVYVTGPRDKPRALIFLGFDAGIKLKGIRRWGGLEKRWDRFNETEKNKQGVGEGPHINGRASGCNVGIYVDRDEKNRTVTLERKGKEREGHYDSTQGNVSLATQQQSHRTTSETSKHNDTTGSTGSKSSDSKAGRKSWAWREKAMYRDINRGFNFGLPSSNFNGG